MMARPNLTNEKYNVSLDNDIIPVSQKDVANMISECTNFRKNGFTKTELINGPYTQRYENRPLCEKLEEFRYRPMWRLIVYGDDTDVN